MIEEGAFHMYLEKGDLEGVRACIKKGADVNGGLIGGYPLQICAARGYPEICQLLLESKANLNPQSCR